MTRRSSGRGFTLVELAIVLSILTLMIPMLFQLWRQLEDAQVASMSRVNAARAVRSISEELQRDRSQRAFADDASFSFSGADRCDAVSYSLANNVLTRVDPCGPPRALAHDVTRFKRQGDLVSVSFAVRGADVDVDFAIGLVGAK